MRILLKYTRLYFTQIFGYVRINIHNSNIIRVYVDNIRVYIRIY